MSSGPGEPCRAEEAAASDVATAMLSTDSCRHRVNLKPIDREEELVETPSDEAKMFGSTPHLRRERQAYLAPGQHEMSTTPRSASRKRASRTDEIDSAAVPAVELPSTRERILNAAVASLIELGTARTTTLEVQRRAEVSRGALLHHFPTHAALLAATVEELIRRNEAAVVEGVARLKEPEDGIAKAVSVLAMTTAQPAYLAELELWAVSRTDPELLTCLRQAERRARKESERVVGALFATAADKPAQVAVMAMTMEFLRGLALSSVLRSSSARRQQLIAQWARAAKILLESLD